MSSSVGPAGCRKARRLGHQDVKPVHGLRRSALAQPTDPHLRYLGDASRYVGNLENVDESIGRNHSFGVRKQCREPSRDQWPIFWLHPSALFDATGNDPPPMDILRSKASLVSIG